MNMSVLNMVGEPNGSDNQKLDSYLYTNKAGWKPFLTKPNVVLSTTVPEFWML